MQHKKRSQSIFLLCCVDSLISKNLHWMSDYVWNRPIMHCKPLVIDYIMYAFVLFFWHARGLHTGPGHQTFAFGNYLFYQFLSIGPFPKKLAPKTSLQGPLWPSSKIFWLKHWSWERCVTCTCIVSQSFLHASTHVSTHQRLKQRILKLLPKTLAPYWYENLT